MADIQVPSIATATPAAADTVLGVQGGAVKRFAISALPFTQAGAGAVARTVEAKLRDTVSVKDFGAVGDGVADDTAKVQAAFDYAIASLKTIHFPAGTYLLGDVDLSAAGSGDEGYRGISIQCDDKAYFTAPDTLTDLFDISGQRRLTWVGGTFLKARRCFSASNTLPVAYCRFQNMRFAGANASDIGACFYGDSYIGNNWRDVQFGTDEVIDQIDTCVDFLGTSSAQTNVNHFDGCVFMHFKDYGLRIRSSDYTKANTTLSKCWFEDSDGIAVEAGSNTKGLVIEDCYAESVGGVSAPFVFSSAIGVHVIRPNFLAANAIPAWISASASEITVEGTPQVTLDGFPMVALSSMPVGKIKLLDNILTPTGTPTYKAALFSIDDVTKEHLVEWSIPRNSSTTTGDARLLEKSASGRYYADGFLRHACDPIALVNDVTWYTVATVAIPGTSSGCRITVDLQGVHQGVGVAAAFVEVFATRAGAADPAIKTIRSDTVGGTLTVQVVASGTNAVVQVQRTGGSNTTVSPLVCVYQGDSSIDTKRISVS